MMYRTLSMLLMSGAFMAQLSSGASAVVYCQYIGYPTGCTVQPGRVLVARPVARAAVAGGVRHGTPMNRGGPVNRVGRR